MVTLYKSAGYWHLVKNETSVCEFPFVGIEDEPRKPGQKGKQCFVSVGTEPAPCSPESF
jgi:hypothetical protein